MRLARLREIIAQIEEELRPSPEPPPRFLLDFRKAIEEAREALIIRNLERAKRALDQAEALLSRHPDDLAMFGRSFLAIKQRYEQLYAKLKGRERIGEALREAETALRRNEATLAAEKIAEAMFQALRTPLKEDEWARRDKQVRKLRRDLRLVKGRRSVSNARRSHQQNDLRARDLQLEIALQLLPELPSSSVADLLKEARDLLNKPIASAVESDLGRELDFFMAYEEALDYYGRRGGLLDLTVHCAEARDRLQEAAHLDASWGTKLEQLVTSALEYAMLDLLALPSSSARAPRELVLVRDALKVALPWKDSPKYRTVHGALVSKTDEIAANSILLARRRAELGGFENYAHAIKIVEPALRLGSADSRKRAKAISQRWQSEYDRLTRLEREQEAWSELRLLGSNKMYLKMWIGLHEFEIDFPDSSKKADIPTIRGKLLPRVKQLIAKRIARAQAWREREDWPKFREVAELLLQVSVFPDELNKIAWIKEILPQLDAKAEEMYQRALQHRLLYNDKKVVAARKALRSAPRYKPEHGEAKAMMKKVAEKAQKFAQGFMLRARAARTPSIQRKLLEQVIAMDPDGKLGAEARDLLAKVNSGAN